MAFVTGDDGALRALDANTGSLVWQAAAGAGAWVAPVVAGGVVAHGTADGWVTACAVATGKRLWSFRVAPFERRIAVFDRLVNRWPVTGLAVDGERLVACAGYWNASGSRVVSLDPQTGRMQWEHIVEPRLRGRNSDSCSPNGALLLNQGSVWVGSTHSLPLILNAGTGERKDHGGGYFSSFFRYGSVPYPNVGHDAASLGGNLVVYGGMPLYAMQNVRNVSQRTYHICTLDEDGSIDGTRPPIRLAENASASPAADDQLLVISEVMRAKPKDGLDRLVAWKTPLFKTLHKALREGFPALREDAKATWEKQKAAFGEKELEQAAWVRSDLPATCALALTKNALLAAHHDPERPRKHGWGGLEADPDGWRLSALEREDGSTRWTVELPGEPIRNGIALCGNGSVVVALRGGGVVCVGTKK
jgi:hypothetical protein